MVPGGRMRPDVARVSAVGWGHGVRMHGLTDSDGSGGCETAGDFEFKALQRIHAFLLNLFLGLVD